MVDPIKIDGIKQFQKALRSMDADLPKMIRPVLNEATGVVVDYAQANFPVKTGKARASLKARSSQREARVALGGRRAPYAPGLDFGGGRPQFPPYERGGRYVYKGLELNREKITKIMQDGLDELARSAGLDVH